ncbi:hypothetical protein [Streptomyces antimicrobicus]|uniref:Uncharacterized protein n=1 Tax=Streptomyces antimicrobicus TaxID=2883108 RepID=A0ABS8BCH2_9ACTN|nr:hypothetical protein [Streptomyces antimicrobicus]MCB5182228.1 hypothetical protein [Streptomyces antimicrobicus]
MGRIEDAAWEPLSQDVARTLALVLSEDTAAHRAYRAQLPHTQMAPGCTCPCGSVHLRVDEEAAAPAPPADRPVVASRLVRAPSGLYLGEALVFAWGGGYLDELELALWEDPALLERPLWQQLVPDGEGPAGA